MKEEDQRRENEVKVSVMEEMSKMESFPVVQDTLVALRLQSVKRLTNCYTYLARADIRMDTRTRSAPSGDN